LDLKFVDNIDSNACVKAKKYNWPVCEFYDKSMNFLWNVHQLVLLLVCMIIKQLEQSV
jgi:hypothetical protein